MEYRLLPGEERAKTYKTDVVMFGIVAKVHTEHDERVVNVWKKEGLTFYGWRHK